MIEGLMSIRCGKCLRIITQTLMGEIVWSEPCECWLTSPPTRTERIMLGGNCGELVTLKGGENE